MYSPYSSQRSSIQHTESEEVFYKYNNLPRKCKTNTKVSLILSPSYVKISLYSKQKEREISEYPQISFNINGWNTLSTNVLHHDYSINVKFKQIESHKHHLPKTSTRIKAQAQTETAYSYYTNSLNESIKRQIRQNVMNKNSLYPKHQEYISKSFNLQAIQTYPKNKQKTSLPASRRLVIPSKNIKQKIKIEQPIRRRSCDCSECGVIKKKIFLPPDLQKFSQMPLQFIKQPKDHRKNMTYIHNIKQSSQLSTKKNTKEQQTSTSFIHFSKQIKHTHSNSWSFTQKFHPDFNPKLSSTLIQKLNRIMNNQQQLARRVPTLEFIPAPTFSQRININQLLNTGAVRKSVKTLSKMDKLIENSYQKVIKSHIYKSQTPKSQISFKNYQIKKYTILKDPYRDLKRLEKGVVPKYLTEKIKSLKSNQSNLILMKSQQMTNPVQIPKQTLYEYVKNMQRTQKIVDSEVNTPINKIQTALSVHVNTLRLNTPMSITATPKVFNQMKGSSKFMNSASSLCKPYESIYSKNEIQQFRRKKETKKDKLAQIIRKK